MGSLKLPLLKICLVLFGILATAFNLKAQTPPPFDPCGPNGPGCSAGPAVIMFSPACGDTLAQNQPAAIMVGAMDNVGKIDTTFTGPITLTLVNGPGTLSGNLNMAFNKGMCVFNNIAASAVGDYTVTFGGGTLPILNCTIRFDTIGISGGSGSGNCLSAGPSTMLKFSFSPANLGVNSSFTTEVRAVDNTNCTDTTFTGTINITKFSGTGNLIGTTSVAANKGVSTFNNLQFDQSGMYVLEATYSGLSSSQSMPINVNGGGTGGGSNCPPTSSQGTRVNMGLYGGSSLDLTYNYSNKRLFAAISSPASLYYSDDTCKTWSAAFPDDSLEYGCGRGWGGRAVRVLTNQNGWVAVQTSQEAGTLNALVISYDGGTTWTTAMDGSMLQSLGKQMQNTSGMSLTDYHMFCLDGKYISKVSNAGPINPSTDILDITTAIPGINSNASVKAIAVANNGNGYPYYAMIDTSGQFGSTPSPLYKFDGTTFTAVTLPATVVGVTNVFTHPNQPLGDTVIIVGSTMSGSKIFRSLDGGTTWTTITSPGSNFPLSDVDYSPDWVSSMPQSNGMVMIIPGVAMSNDLGDTWTNIGLQNNGGAVHPSDANLVVGTMGRGVAVSTTGPAGPYTIANNYGFEAVQIKKISRTASKGTFYLATRAGLAYTTAYLDNSVAGFDKWNTPYGMFPVANVGDDAGVSAVVINPDDSLNVIAGYSNGFAVTKTGVSGFSNVQPAGWNTGGMDPAVRDIIFVNATTALAVTGGDNNQAAGKGNIWRSTDGGTTWSTVTPTGYTCGNSLAKGSNGVSTVIYCGTGLSGSMSDPGTLWKSNDEGATWTQVSYGPTATNNPGMTNLPIYDIAVDPRGTDTLYAACGSNTDYAFARSTDGGSTWNNINASGEGAFTSVCINQTYPDSVYTAIRRDILVYDAATDSTMYIYRGLPGELVPDLAFGSVLAGSSMGFFRVQATPLVTTSIHENKLVSTTTLDIYPNPVIDEATLVIKLAKASPITIKVYDIMGNEAWSSTTMTGNVEEQKIKLNTSGFAVGTYCVRLTTSDGLTTRRFIRIK